MCLMSQTVRLGKQNHHDCTRVARDVLVLGSGESVHKTLSNTSIVRESVDSTIQQQTSQQSSLLESSCLALGVSHEYSGRFPEEGVKQLRSLRGTPQGESVNQLGSGVKRARYISQTPLFQMERISWTTSLRKTS